ncbi:MAG: Trans-aconitate 2-methyltransferase [Nitrosomonadaceae bacterium]|nr:Trans-aconitate 2-methyltransferase [Nitrosomonadaceae bacterium]
MPLCRRDIRKARWYEEVSEFFDIDSEVLTRVAPQSATPKPRERALQKSAMEQLMRDFMSEGDRRLLEKVRSANPEDLSDQERSSSWREYIFVCINGERSSFQRLDLYEKIINCVVRPLLGRKTHLSVLDYGCGSSLLTRLLSQDFPGRVSTISADVCEYSIAFSVARNKLYNENASDLLIKDVMSVPSIENMDLVFANNVFEHLPNATHQIRGLIAALGSSGILVENYPGNPNRIPPKSDTLNSHHSRSDNLDMLKNSLQLVDGTLPEKHNGLYGEDTGTRIWATPGGKEADLAAIKRCLEIYSRPWNRASRLLHRWRRRNLA